MKHDHKSGEFVLLMSALVVVALIAGVGPEHLTWKRVDLERPNQPGSRVFDCKGKVLACTNIVGAA